MVMGGAIVMMEVGEAILMMAVGVVAMFILISVWSGFGFIARQHSTYLGLTRPENQG